MASLSDEQKVFVVKALARFTPAKDIVGALKQEYGVEVPPQNLSVYDPNHVTGDRLSAELKDIFSAERKAYLTGLDQCPIFHQAFRLHTLNGILHRLLSRPSVNDAMVMDVLRQAAEEVGGKYTNKRDVTSGGEKVNVIGYSVFEPPAP